MASAHWPRLLGALEGAKRTCSETLTALPRAQVEVVAVEPGERSASLAERVLGVAGLMGCEHAGAVLLHASTDHTIRVGATGLGRR